MDYDELLEVWKNGDHMVVANHVSRMKPSEIVCFVDVMVKHNENWQVLERMLQKLEQ